MPNEHISSREFGHLEQQVKHLDERVGKLEARVEDVNTKLDTLLGLANRGKGAWWAALTLVSLFSGLATFITTHVLNR